MSFAGIPATTEFDGTSFITTLPAPITTSLPMVTPASMVTFKPHHTLLSIITGLV